MSNVCVTKLVDGQETVRNEVLYPFTLQHFGKSDSGPKRKGILRIIILDN
jgi:hypothetical protein